MPHSCLRCVEAWNLSKLGARSALATNNVLIFNDQQGFIYGLNRITGKIIWTIYALDAKSGISLAAIPIGAGISGPSVADGQVYVGTGITIPPIVEIQGGSILAFGL